MALQCQYTPLPTGWSGKSKGNKKILPFKQIPGGKFYKKKRKNGYNLNRTNPTLLRINIKIKPSKSFRISESN